MARSTATDNPTEHETRSVGPSFGADRPKGELWPSAVGRRATKPSTAATYSVDVRRSRVSLTIHHCGFRTQTVRLPLLGGTIRLADVPFSSSGTAELDGTPLLASQASHKHSAVIWRELFPGLKAQPIITLSSAYPAEHDGSWSVIASLAGAGRAARTELAVLGLRIGSDQLSLEASGHLLSDGAQIPTAKARRVRIDLEVHATSVGM